MEKTNNNSETIVNETLELFKTNNIKYNLDNLHSFLRAKEMQKMAKAGDTNPRDIDPILLVKIEIEEKLSNTAQALTEVGGMVSMAAQQTAQPAHSVPMQPKEQVPETVVEKKQSKGKIAGIALVAGMFVASIFGAGMDKADDGEFNGSPFSKNDKKTEQGVNNDKEVKAEAGEVEKNMEASVPILSGEGFNAFEKRLKTLGYEVSEADYDKLVAEAAEKGHNGLELGNAIISYHFEDREVSTGFSDGMTCMTVKDNCGVKTTIQVKVVDNICLDTLKITPKPVYVAPRVYTTPSVASCDNGYSLKGGKEGEKPYCKINKKNKKNQEQYKKQYKININNSNTNLNANYNENNQLTIIDNSSEKPKPPVKIKEKRGGDKKDESSEKRGGDKKDESSEKKGGDKNKKNEKNKTSEKKGGDTGKGTGAPSGTNGSFTAE